MNSKFSSFLKKILAVGFLSVFLLVSFIPTTFAQHYRDDTVQYDKQSAEKCQRIKAVFLLPSELGKIKIAEVITKGGGWFRVARFDQTTGLWYPDTDSRISTALTRKNVLIQDGKEDAKALAINETLSSRKEKLEKASEGEIFNLNSRVTGVQIGVAGEGNPPKKVFDRFEINGQIVKYCVNLQEALPTQDGGEVKSIGGNNGLDFLANILRTVYKFGVMIISLVCVLIIVVSGVQIINGGLDPEGISQAKTRILQSVLSLVLLIASGAILSAVNPQFFGNLF